MVEKSHKKKIINAIMYCVLIVAYYKLSMEKAVENYLKGSTTIVQRQENISESKLPVLIICPDPPFKPSFFADLNISNTMGAEKYFWYNTVFYGDFFENSSFTPMDLYMNMSYQLQRDMNIFLHHYSVQYVFM